MRVQEASKDLLGDREVNISTIAASLKQWFIKKMHDKNGKIMFAIKTSFMAIAFDAIPYG